MKSKEELEEVYKETTALAMALYGILPPPKIEDYRFLDFELVQKLRAASRDLLILMMGHIRCLERVLNIETPFMPEIEDRLFKAHEI